MAKASHNLSVKVGEYTNASGETKGRWKNIGKVIVNDDGSKYLIMDRTFNPAGVPNPQDRDAITISLFAVDEQQDAAPQRAQTQHDKDKANGYQPQAPEDDIPF